MTFPTWKNIEKTDRRRVRADRDLVISILDRGTGCDKET